MIKQFIEASAIALVLCGMIAWSPRFWSNSTIGGRTLAGIALGIVAVIGMSSPVVLSQGVIFDIRLIIINAATLFGGPLTGAIAAIIAAAYRLYIGGVGAPTGVLSIIAAFTIGVAFHYAINQKWIPAKGVSFFLMGLVTNLTLLALVYLTLTTTAFQNVQFLAVELLLLPLISLLLCLLMQHQHKQILAREETKRTLSRLNAISEAIPDLLLVLDENGKYLEVFSANDNLLALPKDQIIGKTLHEVLPKEQADFFLAWVRSVISDGDTKTIEYSLETPKGVLQFEARGRYLGTPENGQRSLVLLTRDITDRKTLETQVHNLAYYDPLTNLPNRRHLSEHLEDLEKLNIEGKNVGALLHIDLDDFKYINEVHGHSTGDQVLRELVFRLQEVVHAKYYLARIGGDAFAILIEDIHKDPAEAKLQAEDFASRVLQRIKEPSTASNNKISLSGSIGIVMLGSKYPLHKLMIWAELALYAAKEDGKDTLRFFDPILQESVSQRIKTEEEIRVALLTNQFQIFYQPQVNARGQMIGVESLIRWNHPENGILSPVHFLPVAEQAGLISEIDRWVFKKTCQDIQELVSRSNNPDLTVSINVGGSLLGQVDLFEQLSKIVNEVGVDPHRMQIEVTETVLVKNLERSKTQMLKLKNIGFKFSLDDFGTGYSSFNYLRQFPIDEVKIDQSFVHGLPEDYESLAIIRSVVALAPTFGFTVIAEGVESIEQEKVLIENGCNHFQGYFYSKPKPLNELFS